jgi:hypothetical protein
VDCGFDFYASARRWLAQSVDMAEILSTGKGTSFSIFSSININ